MRTVAVVLATLHRPDPLGRVLADLSTQGPDRVVVVDQSHGADARVTQAHAQAHGARYLHQAQPNLPAARNRGWRACTEDVILFLDDDVRLAPGLVDAHRRAYDDRRVGGVGGRIVDRVDRPNRARTQNTVRWDGRVATCLDGRRPAWLQTLKGCHMSFRRAALARTEGFDPAYDGTAYFEDADLSTRVRRLGWRLAFVPEAELVHLSAPRGGVRRSDPLEALVDRAHHTARFLRTHRGPMAWRRASPVWAALAAQRAVAWGRPEVVPAVLEAWARGARSAQAVRP